MIFEIETKGGSEAVNITEKISGAVKNSGVKDGICFVFALHSTVGITISENEEGAIEDLKDLMEKIAPSTKPHKHDTRWGDGNGFAHLRSAILKPEITLPVERGNILLGQWQEVFFFDFDNKPRKRQICVKVLKNG
jgi:secondary thiamine-phosphate synthase enzyme